MGHSEFQKQSKSIYQWRKFWSKKQEAEGAKSFTPLLPFLGPFLLHYKTSQEMQPLWRDQEEVLNETNTPQRNTLFQQTYH